MRSLSGKELFCQSGNRFRPHGRGGAAAVKKHGSFRNAARRMFRRVLFTAQPLDAQRNLRRAGGEAPGFASQKRRQRKARRVTPEHISADQTIGSGHIWREVRPVTAGCLDPSGGREKQKALRSAVLLLLLFPLPPPSLPSCLPSFLLLLLLLLSRPFLRQ